MSVQSQLPRLRILFESALQDYQKHTRMTLISNPIFEQLRRCDSIESVTSMLQDQARTFGEHRVSGRITKSLGCIVSVLYTLSASSALGEATGLVRWDALLEVPSL